MTPTPAWLQEKLFERRIVFVTGRLDDALASQAAAQIMTLDATGDDPIDVVLDSADGTLETAFVLIDVIDAAHATVRVQCQGQVGGPAIGIVAAADQRFASPHATFRLTAPATQLSGTPDQIAAQSEQHRHLLWRFQARLAKATGRPVENIADDMRCARYLDAREALDYGLIDAIRRRP
ncbi:MAG TPA: ATP-dependent Clp protease proteolytic subunit [Methylomirabilota bacterium]|nr:ATP-dependent Clp protease proteolytic subunit [Methylomirabilota bacterium]